MTTTTDKATGTTPDVSKLFALVKAYHAEKPAAKTTTTTTTVGTVWVVTAPSAYRMAVTLMLGRGLTKAAALEDAFGPKPWGPAARKSMRSADVYETTDEAADDMEMGS